METDPRQPEEIELPDIENQEQFDEWLNKYVQRPMAGYDDLTHPDETPLSRDEQIEATKTQLRKFTDEMMELGKRTNSIEKTRANIQNILKESARNLGD